MSSTETFRLLATKTEIADSPFPSDTRYRQVFSSDGLPDALSGGMGVVYHARDTLLGVDVAIKRMQRRLLGDPAAEKRFIQEARTQIRLSHPHIVRMYTINEDDHGPYMVLEWVPGVNLQHLSDTGQRPALEEAVQWVLQIANALHFAHGMGFVHRDVKPGNILLRKVDRQPLLTDFGIVADKREFRGASSISVPGVILGTIDFMAPEQANGSSDIDHRADQWALGAVLAWLLTGKTMKVLWPEILPQHLRDVVRRATEERPQDRFNSLTEFAIMLKRSVAPAAADPFQTRRDTTDNTRTAVPDPIAASGVPGKCWHCENRNPDDAEFCGVCGKTLRDHCLNSACQHTIGVWQRFCSKCGTDQQRQREERQQQIIQRFHFIREQLELQRYDLALADLQQLESKNETNRLRLLLAPTVALRADAERVRNDVQQVIAEARQRGAAFNFAEAMQCLGRIPREFWPAEAGMWQQAASELMELSGQISRSAEQGAYEEFKAGWHRVLKLKPVPSSDIGLLDKCLEVMIRNAEKLQSEGHIEQAVATLQIVQPADRTPAVIERLEHWTGQLAEQLQVQLERASEAVSWLGVIEVLEKLDRLQPGKWQPEDQLRALLLMWEEKAQLLWNQNKHGEVYILLQQVPNAERTPRMQELLASVSRIATTVTEEAATLAARRDYTAAVRCLERLPENLRPASYRAYAAKMQQLAAKMATDGRSTAWQKRLAFAFIPPAVCGLLAMVLHHGWTSNRKPHSAAPTAVQQQHWGQALKTSAPPQHNAGPGALTAVTGGTVTVAAVTNDRKKTLAAASDAGTKNPMPPQSAATSPIDPVSPASTPPATRPELLQAPFSSAAATAAQGEWATYLKLAVQWQDQFGQELRLIPPGEFQMGSNETVEQLKLAGFILSDTDSNNVIKHENPHHRVRITKPFYLGVSPVTRGQFAAFVNATGYRTEAEADDSGGEGYELSTKSNVFSREFTWRNTGFEQTDDHPVVNVTWHDAQAYVKWLNDGLAKSGNSGSYRLPQEAEYEYACRAGTTTRFFTGDTIESLRGCANVCDERCAKSYSQADWDRFQTFPFDDGSPFTSPAGCYDTNPFGLYDMLGNVGIWCKDWYDAEYYANSPNYDPKGPSSGSQRIVRGGSWFDEPVTLRASDRWPHVPECRHCYIGCRVVYECP
jgi:sulfatase modifying factor 1